MEPGDILCKSGHVEFYIGYNYDVTFNDEDEGRASGIASIKISNRSQQGHVTFGWGGVHNTYPSVSNYFTFSNNAFNWYRDINTNGIENIRRHNDDNGNAKEYRVIWRKN